MRRVLLVFMTLLFIGIPFSCRETKEEKKTVVIEKEVEEEEKGALERAGEKADEEVNEEIDEAIEDIGDDN